MGSLRVQGHLQERKFFWVYPYLISGFVTISCISSALSLNMATSIWKESVERNTKSYERWTNVIRDMSLGIEKPGTVYVQIDVDNERLMRLRTAIYVVKIWEQGMLLQLLWGKPLGRPRKILRWMINTSWRRRLWRFEGSAPVCWLTLLIIIVNCMYHLL